MNAINETLASNYILVTLQVNKFPMSSQDAAQTRKVILDTGADEGTAHVVKNIWGKEESRIKEIHAELSAARSKHYALTLPWSPFGGKTSSQALLANTRMMEYAKEMKGHQQRIEQLMQALEPDYAALCQRARQSLKVMGPSVKYPDFAELKSRVGFRLAYDKVPACGDMSGLSLPAGMVEKLSARQAAQHEAALNNAVRAAWEGVIAPLRRVLTQCSKEKARIFDSLLGNLGAVVDSLKAFNLNADPRMDEVADELRALCVRYQTDDLRKSPEVRKAAASDAERTLRKAEEVLANLPW